ncbi:MAG: translation initiation factor IF-2 [Planctomycetes bacterium]|nr:translation initiation factor IF-2 [Planctomycetota bacterium]
MAKTDTKTAVQGMKVSDLAKEFRVTSKVLIARCAELNIKVKNHATILTRGQCDRIRAKLGAGEVLRAEIEKKKTAVVDAKATRKKGVKKAGPDEASSAVDAVFAPPTPAMPDAPAPEIPPPPAQELDEAIEEEAPVEEVVEEVAEAPAAPEPEPVVEPAAPVAPAVAEPPPAAQPAAPPKPRMIPAGPEIAKPIRRDDASSSSDTRFGVVISADEAKKLHGDVEPRRKGGQVVSEKVDEFKAQVSYPSLPDSAFEEEARRAGRGGAGARRGGGRGMPSGRSGPRRGTALLLEQERRRKGPGAKRRRQQTTTTIVRTGPAEVTSPVTVKSLCEALGIKSSVLVGKFFAEGKTVTINDILPDDEAELYASEFDPLKFGIKIKKARDVEEEMLTAADEPDKPEDLKPRAPVVTVMGHVDHGKTSLLDYIRKAKVAEGEHGGITQHIAAYKVETPRGQVCFLDTPGHQAFTEMRARGANVTDIVVLVVAANDGVMPQTEEAISHAKAAGKSIIVAMNKIDLPDANPDRVKGQLSAKEVFVEGYGGETGCVSVSAKTGTGIDDLLERILLEAEVLELKANPDKRAVGTVVEAHKDPGRGIEATVLVQEGSLEPGDVVICGHAYGTVRQLLDHRGKELEVAGPATPVLITGLNEVPLAGERFHVLADIKTAAQVAETRAMRLRQEGLSRRRHVTLENLHDMLAHGEVAALKLVLKVDVMGSLQPVETAILQLATDEARVEVIHSGVGAINETDVHLADASDAIVIGFNVSADPGARRLAEERGVDLRIYNIIYEVVDEMRKALEGLLKPIEQESVQGHLEVRQTFKISKIGTIAGCFCIDGTISRNHQVRLIRDGRPVWNGKLASLKRVKDDVREVREGFECGIKLDGYDDVKQGDLIESFTVESVARTLDGAKNK